MKLINKQLGLPEDASEATAANAIVGIQDNLADAQLQIEQLTKDRATRDTTSAREQAISKKMAQSGGALNRAQAIAALEGQAAEEARRKSKK